MNIALVCDRERYGKDVLYPMSKTAKEAFRIVTRPEQVRGIEWDGYIEVGPPPVNQRDRYEIIDLILINLTRHLAALNATPDED